MERVLRIKKRKRKFEYRSRPTKPVRGRIRKVGIRHDRPIAASPTFIEVMKQISFNVRHDRYWQRYLVKYIGTVAAMERRDRGDDLDAVE